MATASGSSKTPVPGGGTSTEAKSPATTPSSVASFSATALPPGIGAVVDMLGSAKWDPTRSHDWDTAPYPAASLMRIKKDLWALFRDPPEGIVVVPRPDDMASLDCLITGPADTPYEGGFFFFYIRCPPDYPLHPPRIRLMTTGKGTVRFNPNLYRDGKVCLSILGTWSGPAWSPALGLSALVLSVQSLMNERPYHNEPGLEKVERFPGDARRYNHVIRHETMRVAVCETVKDCLNDQLPQQLKEVVLASFLGFYDTYVAECKDVLHMDGQPLNDPFQEGGNRKYCFAGIIRTLEELKERILSSNFDFLKNKSEDGDESDPEESTDGSSGNSAKVDEKMKSVENLNKTGV